MNPYKLAFVVSWFFEFGGMQRTLLRIARECAQRGHEVHVFTRGWDAPQDTALRIHELPVRSFSNHGANERLAQALNTAITDDFDCVIGFNKLPGLDIYYAGDPCFAARLERDKSWFVRWLPRYRALYRQEAAVFHAGGTAEILLIAHQEASLFQHYYGTERERFHFLPPGVNVARLYGHSPDHAARRELRQRFGVCDEGFMLLNIGSRFRTKGVDRILRALGALPAGLRQRSALVVVGGDNPAPYQRLARHLGIADQVFFPGAQREVAAYYYAADLLVHPAYTENTGGTLLEAMACGLPVLATENCGYSFHIRNAGAGLICPSPFRQQILDRQLAEMLTSAERNTWRRNGEHYCRTTDLYSLIEQAADIIIRRAEYNQLRRRHPQDSRVH